MGLFSLELNNDEELEEVVNKHWVAFLWSFLKIIMIISVLAVFWIFVLSNYNWGWILEMFLVFLALIYVIIQWVVWKANCLVITTKRIIDVDQKTFFQRVVAESSFDQLRGVVFEKKGLKDSLFDLGSVYINTEAGGGGVIVFSNIKYPDEAVKLIKEVMEESKERILIEDEGKEEKNKTKKIIVSND